MCIRDSLWSAESSSSIFDFGARRLVKSATADEKPTGNRWNGIWNVLNFSKKKKASLVSLKQPLIELKDKLQEAVKEFIDAKNNLLAAAKEVSSFFQEKVLTLFRFKKTLGILHWVNEVFPSAKRRCRTSLNWQRTSSISWGTKKALAHPPLLPDLYNPYVYL
eukprot:TRINITY_DN5800_c0_g1_i5.p1 TRINITY_DN5800_c0_g1~~TRINITY_DN5800_c0_g1_i5.p1  ORF type:complete len:163 (-),score=29.81 TRINITY_DN5800_c0_g1_i5:118-606(-)